MKRGRNRGIEGAKPQERGKIVARSCRRGGYSIDGTTTDPIPQLPGPISLLQFVLVKSLALMTPIEVDLNPPLLPLTPLNFPPTPTRPDTVHLFLQYTCSCTRGGRGSKRIGL